MFSHSATTPHGSPMMAASARRYPSLAIHLEPKVEPASSSAVNTSWSSPGHPVVQESAAAEYTMAATATFMSPEPSPKRSPLRITGSQGSVSQRAMSPAGLVSRCPDRIRLGPSPAPGILTTRLGRSGTTANSVMSVIPRCSSRSRTTAATARSSPGGFGLGVAISSRANANCSDAVSSK